MQDRIAAIHFSLADTLGLVLGVVVVVVVGVMEALR